MHRIDIREQVADLWGKGKTGQEIASIVGLTRCSILGIIHRMKRSGYDLSNPKMKKIKEIKPLEQPRKGLSLMNLKNYSCRYIVSDEGAEVMYCGEHKNIDSYCDYHHNICYIKSKYQKA